MANYSIEIDASDVKAKLTLLQAACKPERYERALYRIYNRTGGHVRKILKQDLPRDYSISASKVGKAVQNAQIIGNGCIIPVRDKRGDIGTKGQYKASGGAKGWESLHRRYRVKARILKIKQSTLPERVMAGYPPFRNLSAPKLNKLTFARSSKERGPLLKAVGIAIPQMPMNRSMDNVQGDIEKYLRQQIEHEFMNVMSGR